MNTIPAAQSLAPAEVTQNASDVLQARIEIELVLRNPDTASTLKLTDDILDELQQGAP